MCNFAPVRALLIAFSILSALAVSSAIFGLLWIRFGTYPGVGEISLGAAAAWSLGAFATLPFLIGAVNTFCTCASAVVACAVACSGIRLALTTLFGSLLAMIGLCTLAAFESKVFWENWPLFVALVASMSLTAIFTVMANIYGNQLESCQGP